MKVMELSKDLYYVGVVDHALKVFDVAILTKYGTSYNSYLLKTKDGVAVFEGSKEKTEKEYLEHIASLADFKDIKYLFVTHTEPDHSGAIKALLEKNPEITIVASQGALINLDHILRHDFKKHVAREGEVLEFGGYHFRFVSGIMLHWPDVMFTYIEEKKALVSCDAFGCHYAFDDILLSKLTDEEGYIDAFRYYYEKIMGPFPSYAKKAAEKVLALDLDFVLTGHGPVLDCRIKERVSEYLTIGEKFFPSVVKGQVTIVYGSAYGYTRDLAKTIAEALSKKGKTVKLYEIDALNYADLKPEILTSIYKSEMTLLGSPTIAGDAIGLFYDFLCALPSTVGTGRKASAFGDYGWSGEAVPNLTVRLKQLHFNVLEGFKANFALDEAGKKAFEGYISTLLG